MAKIKTPQVILKELTKDIIKEVNQWEEEYTNGCSDPFWPDGCNLNLVRNHVIYYKRKMLQLCEDNNLKVPQEYFIPIPRYIDSNYFAKPNSERAKRILHGNNCVNTEKVDKRDNQQISLF